MDPKGRYSIRQAAPADLAAIVELAGVSFATPWPRSVFTDELTRVWSRLRVLVEEESGCILGFCCFWIVAGEMHLHNVAVHPDHRRHGLGRQLVEDSLAVAIGGDARVAFLEVRGRNTVARELYRSLGFSDLSVRKAYYVDDPDDAIVMTRVL